MKVSRYNFFFPYEHEAGKLIAYNSLSNFLALIEEDKYKKYLDLENNNIQIDDEKLVEDLKKGLFILDDNINELDIIRHNMYASKFNTSALSLTIAPTSDCNFRCIYCYEKDAINSCNMNEETQNSIVKMLEKSANNLSSFSVAWYGGEPLLAIDTIRKLSEKFIKICDENKINYNASMVTNGYNLTKKNWELLKDCKISRIQVTLDGDEDTHNKRRPLKGGYPTFSRIIDNLVEVKDTICPISLRINTDKTNYSQVENILKILSEKELTEKVTPYVAKVEDTNDCYDKNTCLTTYEHADISTQFKEKMKEYGYKMNPFSVYEYPRRINTVCGCDRYESYVINADGAMYKCWNDVGHKEISFANVNELAKFDFNKSYLDYTMYDPTLDEKCKDCKYLPICMGGCPSRRLRVPEIICEEAKYNFEIKMKKIAFNLKQAKLEKEKAENEELDKSKEAVAEA